MALGAFLSLIFMISPVWAQSLDECFKAALKRSEAVAIEEQLIEQAEARLSQAKGSFLPRIDGVASYTRLPNPSGQVTQFTRPERPEVRITGSQAIFRGFSEFAALRKAKLDTAAQEELKRAAANTLYQDVASNFYNVLSLEQDLRNLEAQLNLSRKREAELSARRRIGRSRVSEVLSVESTIATLKSQIAATQAQLAAAREAFAFLTGFDQNTKLNDQELVKEKIGPLETYLSRIDSRPDLAATRLQHESAEESIAIARGGHLPAIDIGGNYYLKRVGVLESQKWDFQATLTLPIFAGGAIQSQVRQAAAAQRAAELQLLAAKRRAEQEVRTLYQFVLADKAQVEALERAAEIAERNYNVQNKEYRLGLVTNLEALQALNAFYDARRSLDRARFATKLDIARLEAAVALRGVN